MPETTSSILNSIHDVSIAVLIIYDFTAVGSHTPSSSIFAITPLLPSIPYITPFPSECFYLSSVIILITSTPQFADKVLGITSKA